MHYGDLLRAADLFMKDPNGYDLAYQRARRNVDWRHFDRLSKDDTIGKAIRFLNEWACRLDSTDFSEIAEGMRQAFSEVSPLIALIENETIEDINFRTKKIIRGKEYDHFEIIRSIFAEFCGIGYRFRWVATSKTLHQILPKLFVMWDNPISQKLGMDLTTSSYVHDFLPRMQKEANEAIETCMEDQGCGRNVAVRTILEQCRALCGYEKTLAKLVDEYNWIKYTKGCLQSKTDIAPQKTIGLANDPVR
jgi:hypothetical protein